MLSVIAPGELRGLPPAGLDRRLAGCMAASLLLHLLLAADWGFDGGRRTAQVPTTLTARLLPAEAELPQPSLSKPLFDPTEPAAPTAAPADPNAEPVLLPLLPQIDPAAIQAPSAVASPSAPWAMPATSSADSQTRPALPVTVRAPDPALAPRAQADPLPRPGASSAPVAPVAPVPPPSSSATPQPELAPDVDVDRPASTDPTWYTGRDLDVLPRPLAPVEPPFPINAQLRGVSGKVTLAVSIDAAGRVVAVDVLAAEPAGFFEESARSAFRAARYAPGIKDGRAVHARLQTVVVFELGPR